MNNKFEKDEKIGLFLDTLIKGGESILEEMMKSTEKKNNNEIIKNKKIKENDIIEKKYNNEIKENDIVEKNGIVERILDKVFDQIAFKIRNDYKYNYEIIEKMKKCLKSNKDVFDLIITKVKNLIKKKRIGINEIGQDFMKSLYSKNFDIICDLFVKIINYLETELSLSTILFSEVTSGEEREQLYRDFKDLLENFDENVNYNGIKHIFLGFKLVGLFKDYKILNSELSNNSTKNIKEGIILNSNHQFKKKLDSNLKEEKINLFNDYILFYVLLVLELKIPKENLEQILIFLNKILKICLLLKTNSSYLQLYLNEKVYIEIILEKNLHPNLYEHFQEMCVFLEKNKLFLSKILLILNEFLSVIPNFNELFKLFYSQNCKNEDDVSGIFETFLCCISDDSKFSFYFEQEKREKYIELLQRNKDDLSLINKDKKINSILMLNIEIFLLIIIKERGNEKLLENTITFLSKEKENDFENQYEINENNFDDKIFLSVVVKQFQKNKKNLKVFDIFLSKEDYLKKSLFFFDNIFEEYFQKNANKILFLDAPQDLEDKINNILSDGSNEAFMEHLLYYFEYFYENNYFKNFHKENDKKYQNIMIGRPLKQVKNYLNDIDIINIYNLEYLYKIGFIKIYFKYFTDFVYECNNGNEKFDFNKHFDNNFRTRLNIIDEIKNNLKLKFKNNNEFETFVQNKKVFYLKKDYYENTENNVNNIDAKRNNKIELKKLKVPDVSNCVPSKKILKHLFNINERNKTEYPFLNQFLNNETEIEYLKYLPKINYISNLMLEKYSFNKTSEELKGIIMNDEELSKLNSIGNIEEKIKEFIESYNSLLDLDTDRGINNKNLKIKEDYKEYSVENFLVNKNDEINKLNHIYNNFIHYQNNFISKLKDKYYQNLIIKEINVQEAKEGNIPNLLNDEFLKIVINNTEIINLKLKVDNHGQDNFKFNYADIENDLAEKIKPGLKMFKSKIETIKYRNEENIIDYFREKYNSKDLTSNQKDSIQKFVENIKPEEINDFLLEIRRLMLFILQQHQMKPDDELPVNDINNLELIKLFFSSINDVTEEDLVDVMNEGNQKGKEIKYFISNLYPLYMEIENYIKNK